MTTRAKHWLCGVSLFVYGSVIHLLLFRLFVRWAYPPLGSASTGAGNRSFVNHPLTNGAITLLGGVFVALLMLRLLRKGRGKTFLVIFKAAALGAVATLLTLQTLLVLTGLWLTLHSMGGPYHDGLTLPGMFFLSMVDIETYGLVVMFQSIPFALGQGVLGGALVVWLRKFFQLSQAC